MKKIFKFLKYIWSLFPKIGMYAGLIAAFIEAFSGNETGATMFFSMVAVMILLIIQDKI